MEKEKSKYVIANEGWVGSKKMDYSKEIKIDMSSIPSSDSVIIDTSIEQVNTIDIKQNPSEIKNHK